MSEVLKEEKGNIKYGFMRENKKHVEYHIYDSKSERDQHRDEHSKKFTEFRASIIEAFGQSKMLCLDFGLGKERYISDPDIIKSFM